MANLAALKQLNLERWGHCQILSTRQLEVANVSKRLTAPMAKTRYQAISKTVWGIPDRWWFVAIVHEREAGQDFGCQLGQGDPLGSISRHIPKGMGPYFNHPTDPPGQDAFYRCAVETLKSTPPFAAKWDDWSIGGALTLFILYNGVGYEDFHHEPSPYDWGATNIEQFGKYVRDGIWNAKVWDVQVGCAAMLKGMMQIDPSISIDGAQGATA